jgi:hypothetical protein
MSHTFLQLCSEVLSATKFTPSYEQCRPHYQRVLDYIVAQPEERVDMIGFLSELVVDGGYSEISLVQFLMESLRWPEIRIAAESRCEKEGNMYWEIKHLIDVYDTMA